MSAWGSLCRGLQRMDDRGGTHLLVTATTDGPLTQVKCEPVSGVLGIL